MAEEEQPLSIEDESRILFGCAVEELSPGMLDDLKAHMAAKDRIRKGKTGEVDWMDAIKAIKARHGLDVESPCNSSPTSESSSSTEAAGSSA